MILVLDRGNNALKAALFDAGRIVRRWRDESPHPAAALRRIMAEAVRACPPPQSGGATPSKRRSAGRSSKRARAGALEGACYSSVVPAWNRAIPAALRAAGVRTIVAAGSRCALPFSLLVDSPDRVGSDRIAAAAGIIAFGGRDAVVIDAGSAVTIDMIAGGAFLGGAIFPGEQMMLTALHAGTAGLPRIARAVESPRLPGRDTEEAMRAGSYWGLVGAVKELTRRMRASLSDGAAVWVTGGGGETLAPSLGPESRYELDLVSIGLHYIFKLNAK